MKNCMPSQEEIESVMAYDGDLAALETCDLFFRVMSSVPSPDARIGFHITKQNFPENSKRMAVNVKLCRALLNLLRDNQGAFATFSLLASL